MRDRKMSAGMEFRKVSDIVAFAVSREEEAAAGYERLLGIVRSPGLKELVRELRDEEWEHKKILENLARGGVVDFPPTTSADLGIVDALVPEPPDEDLDVQSLLILAASKELRAAELYSALAAKSDDAGMRQTFESLASLEKAHKLRLEAEYEKRVLTED